MTKIAQIVVPRPIHESLSYLVPEHLQNEIQVGSYVKVPFKTKTIEGFVVEILKHEENLKQKNFELKSIDSLLSEIPIFKESDLNFYQWISQYYHWPLGEVLSVAFPKSILNIPKKNFKQKEQDTSIEASVEEPKKIIFTDEQKNAINEIEKALQLNQYKPFLLFGITGSGKTEVYLESIQATLKQNKTALVLVPEISLTVELRRRFYSHFGNQVAVLHSSLTPAQRRNEWWAIFKGEKKIIVGARSAIFSPIQNLGIIIVDEEHETSYKQEDRLRYNARDLSLVRGKLNNAAVVLGSATPSLESFYNARIEKYKLLTLTKRPESATLPEIEIIDMKEEKKKFYANKDQFSKKSNFLFSETFLNKLNQTLLKKEQAIIFINRKGYANFIECENCGYVPQCPNCSVSLTYYISSKNLRCHYCGYVEPAPDICKVCHSFDFKNFGLGTETVELELEKHLKDNNINAKIARVDTDITPDIKKIESILNQFRKREVDVLVGTQILAKGHDFPNVTFIGVVNADTSLHLPDFRASERTFQLLAQVAGRAGRANLKGYVVIQTYNPNHQVIQSAKNQNYLEFYESEIEERKIFSYPPFTKIARIEFRHLKEEKAKEQAFEMARFLKNNQTDCIVLGPTQASIYKIANQYRWQILLKSEKFASLNSILKTLAKHKIRFIDIDPVSTL